MEVKNNNKKKKQKETAAFVRTLLTKPISPPSYFTLLSQQLSLLLPEKKPVQLFDISSGFHRNSYSFQTKLFSTIFSENVSLLAILVCMLLQLLQLIPTQVQVGRILFTLGTIILLLYLPIEELPRRIMATKFNHILKFSISHKNLTLTFLRLFRTMEKF